MADPAAAPAAGPMSDDAFNTFLGADPVKPAAAPAAPAGHMSDDQFNTFLGPDPANDALLQIGQGTALPTPGSAPEFDEWLAGSPIGTTLDKFAQGVKDGWGTDNLGLSPETTEAFKKAGIFSDVAKGQTGILRALNEAVIRPAAAAIDAAMRVSSAALGGATAAAVQGATEVGGEQFGRGVGGLIEATTADLGSRMGPHEAPHPVDLNEARSLGVIGEPNSVYFGTSDVGAAANENAAGAARPAVEAPPAEGVMPGLQPAPEAPLAAPPAAPTDVHGLARQIAPDTFNEYDALSAHQDGLRQQITAAQTDLQQQAAAQAPHAAEIADLEERLQDTTPRLAKKYQARLDALRPEHDAFLADEFTMGALTRDTPEIMGLRQQLMETDYRMRDLAPDVSAAYRQAAEQMPAPPELAAPVTALQIPRTEQDQQVGPATPPGEVPGTPAEPARVAIPAAANDELAPPRVEAFTTAKGSTYEVHDDGTTTRNKAYRAEHGVAEQGPMQRSETTFYATPQQAERLGLVQTKGGAAMQIVQHEPSGQWGVRYLDGPNAGQFERRTVGKMATEPAVGLHPVELWNDGKSVHFGNPITEVRRAAAETPKQGELAPVANAGEPARAVRAARAAPASIAQDVSAKLQAAGRPAEEADAAGQVTDAMWQTRADAFDGKKGTAQEMYAREAPEVRAGRDVKAREMELAQPDATRRSGAQGKILLTEDGRSVITLMRSANASTYLHEMGHDWLERMMRDAADPDAPLRMRDDASTVRSYLGLNEGDALSTRAHEKFARSFERYFMEGRAPTRALAGVFGKFKDWLTTIYQTVAKLRAPITPDIRDVFDRLLTRDPEARSIVPETAAEQGELPIGGTMEPKKPTPLFPKPPKEPTRLIAWLRRSGGVRDEGGELTNMLGGPKARPGLISSTGMSLDEAAIKAHEAGYFPEHGEDVPNEREFLDAVEGDLRGEPRYSAEDQQAAAAYQAAVDHNAEVDRLAQDHGIDTTNMTREQFFEALSQRVSEEQFYAEIKSMEEAHESEFSEFAADARDWVEAHEGAWDSDQFYCIDGPRTAQELENAYGSQNAARSAGQGIPGGGDAGPAAGPAGQGEVGGGQGGRGAGDAGRAGGEAASDSGGQPASVGAEAAPAVDQPAARDRAGSDAKATEQPVGAHDLFGRADDGLVDKAGNIRLDNLNRPEDVKAALREAAEAANGFDASRGGIVSDVQRRAMAEATGITLDNFEPRKPDHISPSVWAEQVQKLTVQAADNVSAAAAKFGASGSEADLAGYVAAKQRLLLVADHFANVTAEAGRTLRVFNKADMAFADSLTATLQAESNGRTLFQMQKEAKAVSLLETPAQAAKFMQDSMKASRGDMLLEYWINGLISNPVTHATYMAALQIMTALKAVPDTATAAAIGSIREAMGSTEPRVYWGEVGAQLHGIIAGQRNGVRAAWKAAQTGLTTELPGESLAGAQGSMLAMTQPQGAIPGLVGQIARAPARGVAVLHSYNRAIGYSQEIATQAYRQAAREELEGVQFSARVADLTMNPTPEMMEAARGAATTQTLMNRPGGLVQKVSELTNARVNVPILGSTPIGKFIDPFVSIGANVMTRPCWSAPARPVRCRDPRQPDGAKRRCGSGSADRPHQRRCSDRRRHGRADCAGRAHRQRADRSERAAGVAAERPAALQREDWRHLVRVSPARLVWNDPGCDGRYAPGHHRAVRPRHFACWLNDRRLPGKEPAGRVVHAGPGGPDAGGRRQRPIWRAVCPRSARHFSAVFGRDNAAGSVD